jgi:ribosomal protein L22
MEKQYTPKPEKQMPRKQETQAAAPVEKKTDVAKAEEILEKAIEDVEEQPEKIEEKPVKAEKKVISKKNEAVVDGRDIGISKKHSMAICDYIRGKNIEPCIIYLEKVSRLETPLKMKGEIPHRHGKIMSGRYPVNACKAFIKLLKSLNGNSNVNQIDNPYIAVAVANDASRPFRKGGSMRFKRTNVVLIAKERKMKETKSEKKREEKK